MPPPETAFRWPRTSVDLQGGAVWSRPASSRLALAFSGTASFDAQFSWRSGSSGRGSAASGFGRSAGSALFFAPPWRRCLRLKRPAIGGLGGGWERASPSFCTAQPNSRCGPARRSRTGSQALSSACHPRARQRHFPTSASAICAQPCGDGVRFRPERRLWTLFEHTGSGRRNSSLRDEPGILNFRSCRNRSSGVQELQNGNCHPRLCHSGCPRVSSPAPGDSPGF
jgi:hypothetical protein